jgi:2-polyprenyl-6-methoxyphenol hydroxylase-like FAD-dependent oxidoreductase
MRGTGIRVLVVGAGIAGLAAARNLHGWNATVEVVERAPGPTSTGAGIFLPGNAMRALHQLGFGRQVAERATRVERQLFADHRGRRLVDVDPADVWRGVGDCTALHRTSLHEVLLGGVGDVPIRWGCGPRALEDEGTTVVVDFDDGSTGRYDLVLGADGLHSTVRALTFPAAPPRPVGQHARRFVVTRPDAPPVWSVMLGPGSSFLSIAIGHDQLYCYADGPLRGPLGPPVPLRVLLADHAEPVPTILDALDAAGGDATVHAGAVEEVVLDSWARGRVLLIGDAAHATSPNMAQGAAMALEDALVLTECLTSADSIDEALARYEPRRRPRTDWVLRQTHRRDRTRTLTPMIRNAVLRTAGACIFHANYRPLRQPA